MGTQLEQVAKSKGINPDEFVREAYEIEDEEQEPPFELRFHWRCFHELSSRRSYSGSGPQPIAYSELVAYQQVINVYFLPWELDLLIQLDNIWLEAYHNTD